MALSNMREMFDIRENAELNAVFWGYEPRAIQDCTSLELACFAVFYLRIPIQELS